MNLIATNKHPYESEGAAITAEGFGAQMLIDRGYATKVVVTVELEKPIIKPKQTKKPIKK